ncbi:hypothetical protein MP228_001817 [Amoeboaphelidium protococcarum]|nr:hypothetical protein MP228_001817 [Amoeboaphelidium protococcarum]
MNDSLVNTFRAIAGSNSSDTLINKSQFLDYLQSAGRQNSSSSAFSGFDNIVDQKPSRRQLSRIWDLISGNEELDVISMERFITVYTGVYKQQIYLDEDKCRRVQQQTDSLCNDDIRSVNKLSKIGQLVLSQRQQCISGWSALSDYQIEDCVINAGDCQEIAKCYSNKTIKKDMQKAIALRYSSWMSLSGTDAQLPHNETCFNIYGQLLSCHSYWSHNRVNYAVPKVKIEKVFDDYQQCSSQGMVSNHRHSCIQDVISGQSNRTFIDQCRLVSQCYQAPKSKSDDHQKDQLQSSSREVQIKKRMLPPVIFAFWVTITMTTGSLIVPLLIGAITALLIIVPISINTFTYARFVDVSRQNIQRVNQTQVLLPLSQSTNQNGENCQAQMYWGRCGIPGSKEAQECPHGGYLYSAASCRSFYHFTEGSLMCGMDNSEHGQMAKEEEKAMMDAYQEQNASRGSKFLYQMFTAWRFKCQSLCIKFPDGCVK